jgi:hypothetical protein
LRTTGPENQCAFAELTRGWGGCHRNWLVDWVRARIRRSRIHFLSTAPSLKTTPLFLVSTPGPFRPVITPRGARQAAGTFRKLSIRSANTRRRDEPSPEIAQDCRTKRVLQRMCQIDDEYCFHRCGIRHIMLHIASRHCRTVGAQSPGLAWSSISPYEIGIWPRLACPLLLRLSRCCWIWTRRSDNGGAVPVPAWVGTL